MSQVVDKLVKAQGYAMSVMPKKGGFPVLAEVLRKAGVVANIWYLPSAQAVYLMQEGNVVEQGTPIITGIHEIPKFDSKALVTAIREDQQGKSTFAEFLQVIWQAGVISYKVDFLTRKVLYYGAKNEVYSEEYALVKIPKSIDGMHE